jgi:hypothetical protein
VLAFAALAVDDPTETIGTLFEGAELYAHPAPAQAAAQALAAADGMASLDGTVLAAVVVVFRDDETWGACCPACYRALGDVHACPSLAGRGVMPHEAVVRPAEQLTRSPARSSLSRVP